MWLLQSQKISRFLRSFDVPQFWIIRGYCGDHGGAFYKRKLNNDDFEKRPPQEVLSFVGARSIEEMFPLEDLKQKISNLDPHSPFPGLEKHLSDFDLSGISDRVYWLQQRL